MNWIILVLISSVMFYASAWLFNRVTTGKETITRTWIAIAVAFSAAVAPLAFIVACSSVVASILFYCYKYVEKTTNIKDWFNKDI